MSAALSGKLPADMSIRCRHICIFPVLTLALALSGCQSAFGPQAIERTHPAYNQAIIASINEQMLQNLVRLRYRDVAFFLEIGSVTASLSLSANAGLSADINSGSGDSLAPGLGLAYSDKPTISYAPLRGEDLLKSILSPLRLESILVLTQSGWNISRVFGLCFERINNLYNAPSASGPTPELAPDHEKFGALMEALNTLQKQQLIEIGVRNDGDETDVIIKLVRDDDEHQAKIDKVYELLELDPDVDEFSLNTDFLDMNATQWTVRTRSISGVLYYLSQNVEAPSGHRAAGLVTTTRPAGGGTFDWNDTPAGRLFRIKTESERPDSAYVATHYRGHWFYIADTDLQSKSTFMLLRQLFDLQAGQNQSSGPTLTLPVR